MNVRPISIYYIIINRPPIICSENTTLYVWKYALKIKLKYIIRKMCDDEIY